MTLGERLYNLRKEKNLSQEEVAERLDVTRQTVSKWETDQSTPDFDKIVPICNLYNISTDELITGNKPQGSTENKTEENKTTDDSQINAYIRSKRAKTISISVLFYILSIVWIIIGEMYINEQILIGVFLGICGLTTAYLLYNLIKLPRATKREKYTKYKRIDGIVATLFTLVYLVVSFITMAWSITWLIWLVYAAVIEVIHIALDMREKKQNEIER